MPNIVVIGASAGGVEPLRDIAAMLPADLKAAVFIVMHLSPNSPSMLPKILDDAGPLKAHTPENGEKIRPGHIYVAPPDQHMLLGPGVIHLTNAARENRHRPAIDPLFRSAAHMYGNRVLGIVLTGMSDDGTIGLHIIKHEGGTAIVQDPSEAMFPSMPSAALKAADVDFVLNVAAIPAKIVSLATEKWSSNGVANARSVEALVGPEGEKMSEDERIMGKPSIFTCPDCSGTLWEMEEGGLLHYRCRVGHSYSTEAMREGYNESVEGALWTAVRVLEESASLERRLEDQATQRGDTRTALRFGDVARGRKEQADLIRDILLTRSPKKS